MFYLVSMISFINIHVINERATPDSILLYKLSIQMFKLYNSNEHSLEWISLNLNQILTSQQINFSIMKSNDKKVGLNILTNRLLALNGKIPPEWLNSTLVSFKVLFFFNIHFGYSLYFTVVCLWHITRGVPPPGRGIVGKNRSTRIIAVK